MLNNIKRALELRDEIELLMGSLQVDENTLITNILSGTYDNLEGNDKLVHAIDDLQFMKYYNINDTVKIFTRDNKEG